ncbi:uncharacterized protein LOC132192456 isoform X2 [Neocloeon triangulifer]|uniref:uncharacterized protein LOC132192456 isoform X2 n=1 Tax=Neocloeon triangulifer TaxID=2078957 RepID=UPI00286ECCE1|nr:uncharacterized protein LOC132192456 isoform X2 [Neocloeon triangulifer]
MPLANYLLFLILVLATLQTPAAKKQGKNAIKSLGSRIAKKNAIVKCCGGTSCLQKFTTKSSLNSSKAAVNFIHSKTETLPSFSTSEETTEPAITEVTSEAETTSEVSVSDTSLESITLTTSISSTSTTTATIQTTESNITETSVESAINLSTTTTSIATTTSTTTTITSTTEPPINEDGKCETMFEVDPTLIGNNGTVKDPEKYGFWVQSCGQQYLFGKSVVTWRENLIKCYKLGMEPLTFENVSKLECFSKQLVSKWKFGSNYWTSASRTNESEFSWCTKNGSIVVEKQPWAAGQPQNFNNSENCVHFNVSKKNLNFTFSDRMCSDRLIFACQGAPTRAPCSMPTCPSITCTKSPRHFNKFGYLALPNSHGSWFNYNGRTFVYSFKNKTDTYVGATTACCAIGMSLLSLEYDYKYKSIVAAVKNNSNLSDFYWTSGSDRGCKWSFGYCAANRILRQEAVWASGQPDHADGNESAVAVFVNESDAQLYDFKDSSKIRYICEARDTSKSKSGGTAVRDECATLFNVSQAEIESLLNPSFPKDIRIKCFIKCLGENSNLMVNGMFVENEVFGILETLAAGNAAELQKNVGVMDECGGSVTGMDECDRAAQMIKCSSEKAPEALNGIVAAMDKSMPMDPVLLEPPAPCSYGPFPCNVSSVLAQEVANCSGNCTTQNGFVRDLCGKKYFFINKQMNLTDAYDRCCRYGMQLASIESVEELNCLTFASTPISNAWTFVAGSMVNSTIPRWCTSNATFSFVGYSQVITTIYNPPDNSYILVPDTKNFSVTTSYYLRYPMCKAL